jgi:hypothetical protein
MQNVGYILLGWLLGLVSKPLSDAILWVVRGPRLRLEFDGGEEEFRIRTPAQTGIPNDDPLEAYYVRIKVTNHRGWRKWGIQSLRHVKGYLVNVRRRNNENRQFESVGYCDAIPLKWSYLEEDAGRRGIDIPDGLGQYLNVVATQTNRPDFIPEIVTTPYRYSRLFDPGRQTDFALCLTIVVVAEETSPKKVELVIEWHGAWDNFRAFRYGPRRGCLPMVVRAMKIATDWVRNWAKRLHRLDIV